MLLVGFVLEAKRVPGMGLQLAQPSDLGAVEGRSNQGSYHRPTQFLVWVCAGFKLKACRGFDGACADAPVLTGVLDVPAATWCVQVWVRAP